MDTLITNQSELRHLGFQALAEALGWVNAVRFLRQYDPGSGNYTEERRTPASGLGRIDSRSGGPQAPRTSVGGNMPRFEVISRIAAPALQVFDAARDIDLHLSSLKHTGERAVGGKTSGLIGPGETVTWRARHLGAVRADDGFRSVAVFSGSDGSRGVRVVRPRPPPLYTCQAQFNSRGPKSALRLLTSSELATRDGIPVSSR